MYVVIIYGIKQTYLQKICGGKINNLRKKLCAVFEVLFLTKVNLKEVFGYPYGHFNVCFTNNASKTNEYIKATFLSTYIFEKENKCLCNDIK